MLELRKASGPDSVYFIGSSKHNNEQAYLLRKFVSFWGTNNCDHQARICHSTTVAGVANTWGYGAMTNSYNDMQNSKVALYIGSNAAEAHPVSMLHMLHAKETGCKMIVVDPRFTRTAAKADEYVRIRSGTDIPSCSAWSITSSRTAGKTRSTSTTVSTAWKRCATRSWPSGHPTRWKRPAASGRTDVQGRQDAGRQPPWHHRLVHGPDAAPIGNAMVRASCILQLALGNVGKSGGGTNIFRGHDNVQGATDVGPNPDSLPGYYGLAEGAWKHFANVWGVDFEVDQKQYATPAMMTKNGITVSRWIDGVLEKNEADRPGQQPARRVLLGPCPQLADPWPRNEARHGQAGLAGGGGSLPIGHRCHGRHARQARRPEPQPRGVPAACSHAV